MEHLDSARQGALLHAAAAVPALLRVNDDGLFFLFRVGHHDVPRAHIDAPVAADADIRVKLHRFIRGGRVGYHICFIAHILISLKEYK